MNNFEKDKAIVHCKECHTNWAIPPECIPDKCPFCGKPINAKVTLKLGRLELVSNVVSK